MNNDESYELTHIVRKIFTLIRFFDIEGEHDEYEWF
jgi:hypothetical protein